MARRGREREKLLSSTRVKESLKMTNIVVTEKNEIDRLVGDYFWEISRVTDNFQKALENFKNRIGYGQGDKMILFENDLDRFDDAYAKLKDRKMVLLELSALSSSAKEDSEIYLSFQDFYSYIEKYVQKEYIKNPEIKGILIKLLSEVKKIVRFAHFPLLTP